MPRILKSLKIDADTHRALSHMATDLDLPIGDLATAILDQALKNGPKAVWKITQQAGLAASHTTPETKRRLASLFQTALAVGLRRTAR